MSRSEMRRLLVIALIAAVWPLPCGAQSVPATPKRKSPSDYPPTLGPREGPEPPPLTFHKVSEVPLPGPLASEPAWQPDGTLGLAVHGGWAVVSLDPSLAVRIAEGDPAPSVDGDGPTGRQRQIGGAHRLAAIVRR